jgi:hypothetical protein
VHIRHSCTFSQNLAGLHDGLHGILIYASTMSVKRFVVYGRHLAAFEERFARRGVFAFFSVSKPPLKDVKRDLAVR